MPAGNYGAVPSPKGCIFQPGNRGENGCVCVTGGVGDRKAQTAEIGTMIPLIRVLAAVFA